MPINKLTMKMIEILREDIPDFIQLDISMQEAIADWVIDNTRSDLFKDGK